ncbi:alpha/beta fold hydrolase [Microbacterium sp. USHLN186]|uniref:alpha/beta fold hydrolase n=1 Tax=Microbacterium sp. USHLN186 TaxID=3081286 RepID=UPI003019E7E8
MSQEPATRRHRVGGLVFRTLTSSGPGTAIVVLVHGIGMSHRYLARLHRRLTAYATVVSVDLPGFGGLPRPAQDVDVTAMADALADVLDELLPARREGLVLVGQSMGTQWVTELAVRHPELADAVVLIGPVTDDRRRTVLAQAALLALDTLREPPGANALVFSDYLRCGPVWYLTQLRHMLRYPIEDRVRGSGRRLLIVRGSRDPIAGRDWCRRLRDAARRGGTPVALVEIPGRAHNAQHSAPGAVAAAIVHTLGDLLHRQPENSSAPLSESRNS